MLASSWLSRISEPCWGKGETLSSVAPFMVAGAIPIQSIISFPGEGVIFPSVEVFTVEEEWPVWVVPAAVRGWCVGVIFQLTTSDAVSSSNRKGSNQTDWQLPCVWHAIEKSGWGARIRTWECVDQNHVP